MSDSETETNSEQEGLNSGLDQQPAEEKEAPETPADLNMINTRLKHLTDVILDRKDEEVAFKEICEQLKVLREKESDKKKIAVIMDVIKVRDMYLKIMEAAKEQSMKDTYSSLTIDLEDILYRAGVDSFSSKAGDALDVKTQKIANIVPTDDRALNETIAKSLSCGYTMDNEKILKKETVSVYKHRDADSCK